MEININKDTQIMPNTNEDDDVKLKMVSFGINSNGATWNLLIEDEEEIDDINNEGCDPNKNT